MKKAPTLYIIGAFAAGFILYGIYKSRKQEESTNTPLPSQEGTTPLEDSQAVEPTSTTPVSGTSQTILDGFNENDAQLLKEELKN
jgi:hypothetical protein